jgi:hypothetical protein
MKFIPMKSSGNEIFINPKSVFMITFPHTTLTGTAVLVLSTGVSFEVDGSPSEVREKLEADDKPLF